VSAASDELTVEMVRSVRFDPEVDSYRAESVELAGVPAEWVLADGVAPERTVLYFHGGGYLAGSAAQYRGITVPLARAAAARVLAVDYRLAPEHPFPAALEDAVTAYRWLLDSGTDPAHLVVAGDSAGAALAVSVLVDARDRGLPLAGALFGTSPYADLTASGASLDEPALNQGRYTKARVTAMMRLLLAAGTTDPADPRLSPVFAELAGLPPMLIQVGGMDNLRDDGVRLAHRAEASGVQVVLTDYPDSEHIWTVRGTNPVDPEAARAVAEAAEFARAHA
jgi:monoterpene epsilon-lactone hydrolase